MKKNKTYIIAEIGINHEGNLSRAKKLVRQAKASGADAVKFQVFEPDTLARENSAKSAQQKKYISKKLSLAKMWKKVSLNLNQLHQLKRLCVKIKIDFICSVFDETSLNKIKKLNPNYIKIASSDLNDFYLLKLIKKLNKKIILSTGLSNKNEISKAIKILGKKIILLHCVSSYPCPPEIANLKRIETLRKKFGVQTGYSDHTQGIQSSLIAITLGVKILEKHFTLNKKLKGADHKLSADKHDLKQIVDFANNFEKLMGTGKIKPTKRELINKKLFRKGLYFSDKFKKGHKLNLSNIYFARPETKLKLDSFKKFLGKTLIKDVNKFNEIKSSYFK